MELADEGIRAGFALAVLLVGGLIRFYGNRAMKKLDQVVDAATVVLPKRLDESDVWRQTVDTKLASIDARLSAGDTRMGAIETRISEHTFEEEANTSRAVEAVDRLAEAIREGAPVGRAAE